MRLTKPKSERQKPVSFKITAAARSAIEQIAAKWTVERGHLHSLTDVIQEAIERLAKRELKK
jgi:hypothetical protein